MTPTDPRFRKGTLYRAVRDLQSEYYGRIENIMERHRDRQDTIGFAAGDRAFVGPAPSPPLNMKEIRRLEYECAEKVIALIQDWQGDTD